MTLLEKTDEVCEAYGNNAEAIMEAATEAGVRHDGSWFIAAQGLAAVLLSCDD